MKDKLIYLILIIYFSINLIANERPLFLKQKISIGSKNLIVEVADTPEKLAYGLMYKKSIEENEGMLFIFDSEEIRSFWMKNTFVDLSIGFISKEKELTEIKNMSAAKSEMQNHFENYESLKPAQYALEMRLGWFEKNHIKVHDKFKLFIKK